MKKFSTIIALLFAFCLIAGCLTACGSQSTNTGSADDAKPAAEAVETEEASDDSDAAQGVSQPAESDAAAAAEAGNAAGTDAAAAEGTDTSGEPLQIVTTIFPEYDWVKNILGSNPGNAEVTLLLDNGVDLHSYQPTAEDILKISTCDLFIYVGGESDEWVEDALEESTNPDMQVINLLATLGDVVREEEVVEGMQAEEHDHDHEHEEGEDHDDATAEEAHEEEHDEEHEEEHEHEHEEGEVEYDEHVWLSLRNAQVLTSAIAQAIETVDPANAAEYEENVKAYNEKMDALDQQYKDAVAAGNVSTVLFGDRFPFRYLTDDYGLDYYAAFVGCSAETEASFETITFLSQKMDELGLPAILTIEGKDHKIAETILQNTKEGTAKILTMDSMQATTSKDIENGADYLAIMTQNLEVLRQALTKTP